MKNVARLSLSTVILSLVAGLGGCAHTSSKSIVSPDENLRDALAPSASVTDAGRTAEALARNGIMRSIPELKTLYFDYDSAFLRASDQNTIYANAQYLKSNPDVNVQIAGNCDQRGTVEYNLALGQRRAKAILDYYLRLGIPSSRIATISYGKEKIVCQESSEECWQKNRRADTLKIFNR